MRSGYSLKRLLKLTTFGLACVVPMGIAASGAQSITKPSKSNRKPAMKRASTTVAKPPEGRKDGIESVFVIPSTVAPGAAAGSAKCAFAGEGQTGSPRRVTIKYYDAVGAPNPFHQLPELTNATPTAIPGQSQGGLVDVPKFDTAAHVLVVARRNGFAQATILHVEGIKDKTGKDIPANVTISPSSTISEGTPATVRFALIEHSTNPTHPTTVRFVDPRSGYVIADVPATINTSNWTGSAAVPPGVINNVWSVSVVVFTSDGSASTMLTVVEPA